jgi:WD40 repeat protein/transcriptional regulator with XRE-family HTH domain
MESSHERSSFRGLLLRHRTRTGLIQRVLAARIGVSLRSVQDWEAGLTYPTAERLQALVRVLLEAGGFSLGREGAEVHELWEAAAREAPRMRSPFDEQWFAGLLAARAPQIPAAGLAAHQTTAAGREAHQTTAAGLAAHHATAAGREAHQMPSAGPEAHQRAPALDEEAADSGRMQDWGEAPDTVGFVGRHDELALLRSWLLEEHCRVVALLGMGGIGKTCLTARLAQSVATSFPRLFWRSLRNAPPVNDWLAGAIGFLSNHHVVPPASEQERIIALLQLLRARRCLLVLDNSETLFEPGQREGRYRDGMDGYGLVLQSVGEASHQSCLLLTSREAPPELAVFGSGVRSLQLHGLGAAEAQSLLADKQLTGDARAWVSLVDRYGGNGLALKIVAETIRQLYDGDVSEFLAEASATYGTVFGGVRRLLDAQAERLSTVERDVLSRMAVEREPIGLLELSADMPPSSGQSAVIEAIETLRRRSLVEPADGGAKFTLQSMVLEYMTDWLVDTVSDEITRGEPAFLVQQPLIRAQAKDYVRQTQERLIGVPILQRLDQGTGATPAARLLALLDEWRGRLPVEQGCGPGNVVNLLRLLRGDLRGIDLSRLVLRQVYLQSVDAQDGSLASAHLAGAVLDEPFAYPTAVALSADGAVLVAGTPAGDVRVWRTADRTLLLAVQGHAGMVWGVAVSRDGQLVASVGDDGQIRVWAAGSGRLLTTVQVQAGPVWGVALSTDGRLLASGGEDGIVRLWDSTSGQLLASLQGHTGGVRAVALSGDVRLVASGGDDFTLRVWEVESGHLVATLHGHTGVVFGLALSDDGGMLVSGGVDGTVRLWKPAGGELLATLEAHPGGLRGVALSADARVAASGGGDGLVRLWDTGAEQVLANLLGHTGAVWCMALSADGQLVASGSQDGTVRLWEAASGQLLAAIQGHTGVILSVSLVDDGRIVASGGVDGTVRLWDPGTGRPLAALQGHAGLVRAVALSADARMLASAGDDGTIRLWEPHTGRSLAILEGHSGTVWCMALSHDGRRIASGGVDNSVRVWDTLSRRLLATLRGHASLIWGVAISTDGRFAASSSLDGTVRLWDAESGQPLTILHNPTGAVFGLTLSSDGRLVAGGCVDGTVRLWETGSGHLRATLHGHSGLVYAVALSADGRVLASGGAEGMVKLWETASGQLLTSLAGHVGVVWGVAFSHDGRLLASGGDDGMLRLWDVASGALWRTLRADRRYERLDISSLTGVTDAQRAALLELGALETPLASAAAAPLLKWNGSAAS